MRQHVLVSNLLLLISHDKKFLIYLIQIFSLNIMTKAIEMMFQDTDGMLNWPDSRPGTGASAQGSRSASRGESLMTYSRAGSRSTAR